MNNQLKEKKTGVVEKLPQPQDVGAAPLRLGEESSSECLELQEKMKAAAREFANLLDEKLNPEWDMEDPFDLFIYKQISPFVALSPRDLFYRFNGEWVRIAEKYMRQPDGFYGTPAELLEDLRKFVTKYGRVSWVLPKLQQEGGVGV